VTNVVDIERGGNEREGDILQDAILPSYRSCLVHIVDYRDSEEWCGCDKVTFLTCFVCLLAKQHTAFK